MYLYLIHLKTWYLFRLGLGFSLLTTCFSAFFFVLFDNSFGNHYPS
jgi:hypothetical protein